MGQTGRTETVSFMKRLRWVWVAAIVFISVSAAAERLTVKADVANIRSGPGTNFDILWQVQKYHPILTLKMEGAWYQFKDFENDRGWIHKSLVADIPAVITARAKCNVRQGPGTGYKIAFTVENGVPFRVLDRRGKWLKVQHADGDRGWIHSSLVW
jgi:SH3-like domain-containing protein